MPKFDPFHQWLAIPPNEQPPHHYRLLGVTLFESDLNVIDTAANQKMAYLHSCATGEHADLAEQLMNRVSEARLCLLDANRKASYDSRLRKKQHQAAAKSKSRRAETKPSPVAPPPIPATPKPRVPPRGTAPTSETSDQDSRSQLWFLIAGVLLGAVMLGGAGVFIVVRFHLFQSNSTQNDAIASQDDPRPTERDANPVVQKTSKSEPAKTTASDPKRDQESKPVELPKRLTDSIGMQLVLIPAGEFEMGAGPANQNSFHDERPRHKVRISRPFYLGQLEVTQAEWKKMMVTNPSPTHIDDRPVSGVTWDDAAEFCRRLSMKEGHEYRLPTEAEWEYACRAGNQTVWSFGNSSQSISDFAWCNENASGPRECGGKYPNDFGVYDMHGNVSEWCRDWYDVYVKSLDQTVDPTGPTSTQSNKRVNRGGDYGSTANQCRCSYRDADPPTAENPHIGFRVVRVLPASEIEIAKPLNPPQAQHAPTVENEFGMSFVLIPRGEFKMGTDSGFGFDDEKPQHRVEITKPFYLGKYEVSVKEFERVMSWTPDRSADPDAPVSELSFEQAETFCRRLGSVDGHSYRLPTEAEWEYACRAGATTKWSFGDDVAETSTYAWYSFNSKSQAHPRGTKAPNAFGLYDMHGNVSEWCADWYKGDYYEQSSRIDPRGPFLPQTGRPKIVRGGSFADLAN
ncbi:MAG: formylglycine-generating enzyme family protein, partial [Planctomycetota bacterium]|nr:formylglycine-generating enzyme family protein [Planctomycetota bacterium]